MSILLLLALGATTTWFCSETIGARKGLAMACALVAFAFVYAPSRTALVADVGVALGAR